jgi:glucan biosynthesis protein C
MSKTPPQREFFLDSIRAWLMFLGIPFHLSLIYSNHPWHVNSAHPSAVLTLLNDFIHAFRMQVFFVISGYFSYMLFLRYPRRRWWNLRVKRVGIPMLAAIPLLTLPQFVLLQRYGTKEPAWRSLDGYQQYNTLVWGLVSHLWFLLALVILTAAGLVLFQAIRQHARPPGDAPSQAATLARLSLAFLAAGVLYAVLRRAIFAVWPAPLSDGLFTLVVLQPLFYLPFFLFGALVYKHPPLKRLLTTPSPGCAVGAALAFAAYLLNLRYGLGDDWMYEIEAVVTMLMGLWMTNLVFATGHRLLNAPSKRTAYLVNASLFIYLVHHPLTLLFGAWITPLIASNLLGFLVGMAFVNGGALLLYELHLRVPLLRFLFSGKPQSKAPQGA